MWNDITGITTQFVWHRLEITIRMPSCEWNNILQRDIYKGRKKNKSCTWRTTCEKRSTSADTMYVRNTKLFISRTDLFDQLVDFQFSNVCPVKSDNDEKIMAAKLNKVTMLKLYDSIRSYANVVLLGLTSDDIKQVRYRSSGRTKLNLPVYLHHPGFDATRIKKV